MARIRTLATVVAAATLLTACTGPATGPGAVDLDGDAGPQLKALQQAGAGQLLRVEDRAPAPTIRGETLDGEDLDVRQYEGQVVVVNFWASWCPPCRAEAQNLVKVATDLAPRGVQFVGVNVKDSRGDAARYDEKQRVPYPSIFDQPGVTLTRFRSLVPQYPPSTLLIDRQGRLAMLFVGGVTETELSGPVQALAAEKA